MTEASESRPEATKGQEQADHEFREGQHAHDESRPEQDLHDMARVEEKSDDFWAGRNGEPQPEHDKDERDKAA